MSEGLKSKVMDVIDSLIPKGQNSLSLREMDVVYGIYKAKEAVEKLFTEISTHSNDSNTLNALDCVSRKAAIETAQRMYERCDTGDIIDYRDMVVESLKVLPTADIDLSDYSDRLWRNAYEQGKADAEAERKTWRWNDHEVACIIADLMGDACACNHNGIDEWLPKFCDFANTDACPHPVGVSCWEQFLKWKGENDG